jgi:Xaa-Pro aminopeptidase
MDASTRLKRLQAHLRKEQIPLAFLCDPQNVCYLTGYWTILSGIPGTDTLLAVPADGAPWLAVPGLEVTLAREQCPWITDIRYMRPAATLVEGQRVPAQTLAQLLESAVAARPKDGAIALDTPLLRTDKLQTIMRMLEGRRVVDLVPALSAMRASKDPDECQWIQQSAAIVTKAAQAIARAVRPGVTENALAAEAVRVIWAHGGTITHLVVASGPRGALPHALPTDRAAEPGDFIVVDIGVLRGNYWAEIARTYVAGPPTAEQTRLLNLVGQAQLAARRAVRAGIPANEVDEAARAVLRKAGYDDATYIHSTGHGLGIMGPDAPVIAPHTTAPVPLHATLTLEPGLYFPGIGGLRIEDSFFVSETSLECWTA